MLEGTEAEAQALREEVATLAAAADEKDQALSSLQVAKAQLESSLDEVLKTGLLLRVWDKDLFSKDDDLGEVTVTLDALRMLLTTASHATQQAIRMRQCWWMLRRKLLVRGPRTAHATHSAKSRSAHSTNAGATVWTRWCACVVCSCSAGSG